MLTKCLASQLLAFVQVLPQTASWAAEQESPGERGLLAYLGGGDGLAWIACYKSTWQKAEVDGAGRQMEDEQEGGGIRVWGWHRVLSRGKPQRRLQQSADCFLPFGWEVPGPQVSAGSEGATLCQYLPSGLRGCTGVWNPAGLELEVVLGIVLWISDSNKDKKSLSIC